MSDTGELDVAGLTGADVSAFLLEECARVSVGSAKGRVAELRALLRFLFLRGFTEMALADSVPSAAGWRDTEIPATMPVGDVQRLLGACDRATLGGARNYAIMLLLARLGLRSIEVARLQLEDLDWRAGELVVRGKARRHDRLPLPADVGEALAGRRTPARKRRAAAIAHNRLRRRAHARAPARLRRLYGRLLHEYRGNPLALARDLPHRARDWTVVTQRIGWATFEDCRAIEPTACPWLTT